MQFDLKSVLNTAGPTASLVFASWILLSVLQERYSSAHEHYRALLRRRRELPPAEPSEARLEQQLRLYKRRCDQLRVATSIALIAAILLITTIITGTLYLVFPRLAFLEYVSVACSVTGLLLVIGAALVVLAENALLKQALDTEASDIPGLAPRRRAPAI